MRESCRKVLLHVSGKRVNQIHCHHHEGASVIDRGALAVNFGCPLAGVLAPFCLSFTDGRDAAAMAHPMDVHLHCNQ